MRPARGLRQRADEGVHLRREERLGPAHRTRARAARRSPAGLKQYDDGEFPQAAKSLQAALDQGLRDKDKVNAHKHLAFIHCSENRTQRCRDEFRKALAVDPAHGARPGRGRAPRLGAGLPLGERRAAKREMEQPKLGRYVIQSEIGRGAMGVVYKATDSVLERTVAIKTVNMTLTREEREGYEARFYQEARAAGGLNHPNIVTIYDVGSVGDVVYMAMEFIEGVELRTPVRRRARRCR